METVKSTVYRHDNELHCKLGSLKVLSIAEILIEAVVVMLLEYPLHAFFSILCYKPQHYHYLLLLLFYLLMITWRHIHWSKCSIVYCHILIMLHFDQITCIIVVSLLFPYVLKALLNLNQPTNQRCCYLESKNTNSQLVSVFCKCSHCSGM